jgi:hypothetical protein
MSWPLAFTLRTAFQPLTVVGAVVDHVVPSVEYEIVQPAGAIMSVVAVSFNVALMS